MNWEAIGASGEVIAAAAVVVSVFYLALQIRHTSKLLTQDKSDKTQEQMNQLRALVIENRDVAELVLKGRESPELLDDVDRYRFSLWLNQQLFTNYQIWLRYRGTGDPVWVSGAGPRLAQILQTDAGLIYWEEWKSSFDEEFVNDVELLFTHVSSPPNA